MDGNVCSAQNVQLSTAMAGLQSQAMVAPVGKECSRWTSLRTWPCRSVRQRQDYSIRQCKNTTFTTNERGYTNVFAILQESATSNQLASHIISMDKTFWQEMDEKKMEKMESVGDNELMQKQSRCKQTDVKKHCDRVKMSLVTIRSNLKY